MKMKAFIRVRLFVTPRTVAYQAPPSMGFSRQGYWNGLPFPSPGDLPNPGTEPRSPTLQADTLPSEPRGKPQGNLLSERIVGIICTSCFNTLFFRVRKLSPNAFVMTMWEEHPLAITCTCILPSTHSRPHPAPVGGEQG